MTHPDPCHPEEGGRGDRLTLQRLHARLQSHGLALPEPAPSRGQYLSAVRDGARLWVSGHTGRRDGQPATVGRVGCEVTVEEARRSARFAMVNLLAAAVANVAPEELASTLHLRGYVRAVPDFGEHSAVVDAASEVLGAVFVGDGHARTAIGVASLPGGACVELEAVFRLR